MKLLSLEIPDDPALVPEWLERHLVGQDLPQLVTELGVLARQGPSATLQEVLAEKGAEVLQLGLRSLSRPQLRQLVNQPQLLVELQQLVLEEGGNYWTMVSGEPGIDARGKRMWKKLQSALASEKPKSELNRPNLTPRHPWLIAGIGWLSAVAALVFAIFVQGDRIAQLRDQLTEQTSKAESLRLDLRAERTKHPPLNDPSDTPEGGSFLSLDDTPEPDPNADLP